MSTGKMHDHEVETDVSLARRLVAGRFPRWADLRIEPVASSGTDHALYRLGDDMVVRLPRIADAQGQAEVEMRWLPKLAPHLPVAIPEPLATAPPVEGYPFDWSIYRWLDGETATNDRLADPLQAASDLAGFVSALHRIDTTEIPGPWEPFTHRGAHLAGRDRETRESIASLAGMFDVDALIAQWDTALSAPAWSGPPVWIHGDLLPTNLLVDGGRLTAVIDFGAMGTGDPACDVMPAWVLFGGVARDAFREGLDVDDATWARGRGWALSWAAIFIPYYVDTNPVGVDIARRTIEEVLSDPDA